VEDVIVMRSVECGGWAARQNRDAVHGRKKMLLWEVGFLPHRGAKFCDKARMRGNKTTKKIELTFSNFSMVRLSIPPHL